jgi:hypothetical protein
MRIFLNKWFVRFARKEDIDDAALCDAIVRAEKGLIDADLGGGLIKQRIARRGEGRSGGYRSIVVYRSGTTAFFIFGFAKSRRKNLVDAELEGFKRLSALMLRLDDAAIAEQMQFGELKEIFCHG